MQVIGIAGRQLHSGWPLRRGCRYRRSRNRCGNERRCGLRCDHASGSIGGRRWVVDGYGQRRCQSGRFDNRLFSLWLDSRSKTRRRRRRRQWWCNFGLRRLNKLRHQRHRYHQFNGTHQQPVVQSPYETRMQQHNRQSDCGIAADGWHRRCDVKKRGRRSDSQDFILGQYNPVAKCRWLVCKSCQQRDAF